MRPAWISVAKICSQKYLRGVISWPSSVFGKSPAEPNITVKMSLTVLTSRTKHQHFRLTVLSDENNCIDAHARRPGYIVFGLPAHGKASAPAPKSECVAH